MSARQYPNNIAPNGDTVKQCLINDDLEIKRVLDLMNVEFGQNPPSTPQDGTIWYELVD